MYTCIYSCCVFSSQGRLSKWITLCTYMYAHAHTHAPTHTCTYTHAPTHTHTYTHTCTYTHSIRNLHYTISVCLCERKKTGSSSVLHVHTAVHHILYHSPLPIEYIDYVGSHSFCFTYSIVKTKYTRHVVQVCVCVCVCVLLVPRLSPLAITRIACFKYSTIDLVLTQKLEETIFSCE